MAARLEQARPRRRDGPRGVLGRAPEELRNLIHGERHVGDARALEVPLVRDVPVAADQVHVGRIDDRGDLGGRPDEELALLALAVGVGGRVEAPVGVPHLPQQVVERLLHDAAVPRIAGGLEQLEVEPRDLGVVVEHLLEVRDQPARVDRVAMKPAADLVVDASVGHAAAGEHDRIEKVLALRHTPLPEEELEGAGVGKLGSAAEATVQGVDVTQQAFRCPPRQRRIERDVGRRGLLGPLHAGYQLRDRLGHVVRLVVERARHRLEDARKRRHAVPIDGREVGAAMEGTPVGRQEDGERPAAAADHELHRPHVDVVDVRAFLTIDLDVDEPLVHERRGVRVLERLAFHDVAPVTGRVSDREEDRLGLRAGAGERLVAPGIPVDGIVRVLQEVWAGLVGEPVGAGHGACWQGLRVPARTRGPR